MTTRTTEPTQITTREEVSWTRTFCDYPATLWQLNYYFRGPGTGFNAAWGVEVTADGDDFAVTVPAAKTDDVTVAGNYTWQAWVTEIADSTNKKMIASDKTKIVLGFDSASVTTVETRSPAKIALDVINAAISGQATANILEYEITTPAGTHKVKRMTMSELLAAQTHFAAIVANENTRERIRNGGPFMQRIGVTFHDE